MSFDDLPVGALYRYTGLLDKNCKCVFKKTRQLKRVVNTYALDYYQGSDVPNILVVSVCSTGCSAFWQQGAELREFPNASVTPCTLSTALERIEVDNPTET